jgi:cytochrome b561
MPQARHDRVTRLLHGALAASVLALLGLGAWMVTLNFYHPWYHRSLEWHKAGGMLALGLIGLKLLWRVLHPPLPLAKSLAGLQRRAAQSAHAALLLLALVVPLTGYAISTSTGEGIDFFGLGVIPDLLPRSTQIRDWATALHAWLAYGMAAVIAVHAAAALKHGLWHRDGTLRRMFW